MKYLNERYYVEVKDHRYKIHPTENIILRLRDETNLLEHNIKYKMRLRYEEIRKLLKMITIK